MPGDTIYALSSGAPPAAIAVIRISGSKASDALNALAGRIPEPRRASLARFHHPVTGDLLDNGLALFFPGPGSATGEDTAELHLHGGRSVVRALLGALAEMDGLREAQPGEFTRRAFGNGRIDLAEAEGLADLLLAETDSQRRAALTLAGGALSRAVEGWRHSLLLIAAELEAALDFADEGDVDDRFDLTRSAALAGLICDIAALLDRPGAERLRDGVRVAIAGPPNSGKSSLLNCLAGRRAAITSPVAGTTRDLVEAPTAIGGTPFLLVDTAGLRQSEDQVEAIGVQRAHEAIATADLILWLGHAEECPTSVPAILVQSMADLRTEPPGPGVDISVSSKTGAGIDDLVALLVTRSRTLLPLEGEVTINLRHRASLADCLSHLRDAQRCADPVLASEDLRQARAALDRVTGRAGVEDMLDALFGRFCIGK